MKKQNFLCAFLLLTLTLAACSTAPSAPTTIVEPTSRPAGSLPQTEADVPRVTVEQARIAFEGGAAVIVDVRATESFAARHIAGAISLPLSRIETNPQALSLDQDQWIITYCT